MNTRTSTYLNEVNFFVKPLQKQESPSKKCANAYTYGFNGQERETAINQSVTSAEYWFYDGRLGRRWNVDPVSKEYESPYACLGNNPILLCDIYGSDTINITSTTTRQTFEHNSSMDNFSNYRIPDVITNTGNIEIKESKGEDIFILNRIYTTINPDGTSTTTSNSYTLQLNNPNNSYRTGGHRAPGYIDDRYALAANAPTWLLKYYANKSGDIGVKSALAYQKSVPVFEWAMKVQAIAYTVSGVYGLARGFLFRNGVVGYNSMREFTNMHGTAPSGYNWHHYVEQRLAKNGIFSPQLIYSTENTVLIKSGANSPHSAISAYYSSIRKYTNGLTVRKWLESKSFEEHLKFGKDIYNKVMNGQPLP